MSQSVVSPSDGSKVGRAWSEHINSAGTWYRPVAGGIIVHDSTCVCTIIQISTASRRQLKGLCVDSKGPYTHHGARRLLLLCCVLAAASSSSAYSALRAVVSCVLCCQARGQSSKSASSYPSPTPRTRTSALLWASASALRYAF